MSDRFGSVVERQKSEPDIEMRRLFGRHVQTLRRSRSWTQEDLAEAAGLDRSYVAGVEAGRRNPSLGVILRLAAGLGLPASELFSWDREPRSDAV